MPKSILPISQEDVKSVLRQFIYEVPAGFSLNCELYTSLNAACNAACKAAGGNYTFIPYSN